MPTCVIDEGVETPMPGLDRFKRLLNRLVAGDVKLDRFNGVGRLRTLRVKPLNRLFSSLQRSATNDNMEGFSGAHECLDGLVANVLVPAGDEDDFGCCGCHGVVWFRFGKVMEYLLSSDLVL